MMSPSSAGSMRGGSGAHGREAEGGDLPALGGADVVGGRQMIYDEMGGDVDG